MKAEQSTLTGSTFSYVFDSFGNVFLPGSAPNGVSGPWLRHLSRLLKQELWLPRLPKKDKVLFVGSRWKGDSVITPTKHGNTVLETHYQILNAFKEQNSDHASEVSIGTTNVSYAQPSSDRDVINYQAAGQLRADLKQGRLIDSESRGTFRIDTFATNSRTVLYRTRGEFKHSVSLVTGP